MLKFVTDSANVDPDARMFVNIVSGLRTKKTWEIIFQMTISKLAAQNLRGWIEREGLPDKQS